MLLPTETATQLTLSVLAVCCIVLQAQDDDEACAPPRGQPGCVCETSHGIIDFTSIGSKDGEPRLARVC